MRTRRFARSSATAPYIDLASASCLNSFFLRSGSSAAWPPRRRPRAVGCPPTSKEQVHACIPHEGILRPFSPNQYHLHTQLSSYPSVLPNVDPCKVSPRAQDVLEHSAHQDGDVV